jgi:hypothetical protein
MQKQSALHRAASKLILWGIVISMLIFTATRTMHFLMLTIPVDQQYTAYLALAAFDIGVLAWLYYATNAAEGTGQRVVAYGMIFVCSGGVLATTFADMQMGAAANGLTPAVDPNMATTALWAVMIVIALNFFGGVMTHLLDPKHMKHLSVEGAKDRILTASLTAIDERAGEVAPRIAAAMAEHWERQILIEMVGSLPVQIAGSRAALALPSPKNADVDDNGVPAPAAFVPSEKPAAAPAATPKANPLAALGAAAGNALKGAFGGNGKQEAAALTQTGQLPALSELAELANGGDADEEEKTVAEYLAWKKARQAPQQFQEPSPAAHTSAPAPVEHRTCSECPTSFVVKNAKQLTCSPGCRNKRARRLAKEKKQHGA